MEDQEPSPEIWPQRLDPPAMQIKQHLQELEDRPQWGHVRSSYGRAATTVVCHKRKISLSVVIVATKRRPLTGVPLILGLHLHAFESAVVCEKWSKGGPVSPLIRCMGPFWGYVRLFLPPHLLFGAQDSGTILAPSHACKGHGTGSLCCLLGWHRLSCLGCEAEKCLARLG
eukprot:symbB.v1.2.020694.t1/scaffold1738.1/size103804/6